MTAAETGSPIRVLLVDDGAADAASLRGLIERQPELTVVGVARDGEETVELAERLRPDAVVVDLHMPDVDGLSAVARLRKAHPALCVIALTGGADRALHHAAADAGADGVLVRDEMINSLVERLSIGRI